MPVSFLVTVWFLFPGHPYLEVQGWGRRAMHAVTVATGSCAKWGRRPVRRGQGATQHHRLMALPLHQPLVQPLHVCEFVSSHLPIICSTHFTEEERGARGEPAWSGGGEERAQAGGQPCSWPRRVRMLRSHNRLTGETDVTGLPT